MVSVGLLDILGLGTARPLLGAAQSGIVSPWAEGNLSSVVWSDVLGDDIVDALPLTRAEAISLPAVSKARNLLCATVGKFPLVAARYDRETGADTDTTRDHPWLYRTNGPVTPYSRMVWTVDDGIFYGCSLWLLERGEAQDGRRPIVNAAWCPFDWWTIEEGRFVVRENGTGPARKLERDEYLFFDFPFEGLLNVAGRTLRGAREQERAWVGRAKNPIPLIDLHRTDDYVEMQDGEVEDMVQAWATARTNVNGAIGSTPHGIDLRVHGDVAVDLMIEGRNAVRTDVGSFLNVRVAMLDGTIGVDSLTYTTKDGERNAFFEFDLPFWTDPIEARLSLDDVVPRGQRVRFQKYQETPEPIGPGVED
jgi:hypothetical protein